MEWCKTSMMRKVVKEKKKKPLSFLSFFFFIQNSLFLFVFENEQKYFYLNNS
jgi:hypothetical protein